LLNNLEFSDKDKELLQSIMDEIHKK